MSATRTVQKQQQRHNHGYPFCTLLCFWREFNADNVRVKLFRFRTLASDPSKQPLLTVCLEMPYTRNVDTMIFGKCLSKILLFSEITYVWEILEKGSKTMRSPFIASSKVHQDFPCGGIWKCKSVPVCRDHGRRNFKDTNPLKVHKNENFLPSILNFVLFQC